MFEPMPNRSTTEAIVPAMGKALLQIALVYPVVFLFLAPVLEIARDTNPSGTPQPAFADMGLMVAGGAALGIVTGRFWPALARTGRWLWLPPAIWLCGGLVTQMLNPPPASAGPSEYFFRSSANEGLAVFLGTLPTCCLTGYSLGLWGALRLKASRPSPLREDAEQGRL